MRGDCAVVFGVVFILPDLVKQLLGADHLSLVLTQDLQNGELRGGQGQGPVVQSAGVGLAIQHQAGDHQGAIARLRSGIVLLVPPQLGLDPGHQLQGLKGLGHIVVRPQGEAGDLVHALPFGRQHNNGEGMGLPDLLAELEAVQIRQHHVQNGQIQWFVCRKVQRAGGVIGFADPKSFVLQRVKI